MQRSNWECILKSEHDSITLSEVFCKCPCVCLFEWRGTPQDEIWYWKQNVRPATSSGQSAGSLTGVYCGPPSIDQSQLSHEPPASVLLTYDSIKWAGFYGLSGFWLAGWALLSVLASGSAPPNGKQRRLLNLSLGKKRVKGETDDVQILSAVSQLQFTDGSSGKLSFFSRNSVVIWMYFHPLYRVTELFLLCHETARLEEGLM